MLKLTEFNKPERLISQELLNGCAELPLSISYPILSLCLLLINKQDQATNKSKRRPRGSKKRVIGGAIRVSGGGRIVNGGAKRVNDEGKTVVDGVEWLIA
jgi:hypothetical protein